MNFKTTIILIFLLAIGAAALFFTRERGGETTISDETASTGEGTKLLSINSTDITKLSVEPADGEALVLEKPDGIWKLVKPVDAQADSFTVDSLVSAVSDLRSRGTADLTDAMGLAQPAYQIKIEGKDGKSESIAVGRKSAVGDLLYVALDGETDKAHIVGSGLIDQLEKPASEYREKQLINLATAEVMQVEVTRPAGKLVLQRSGADWSMIAPSAMPADTSSVTDLISAATGVRAEEFVSESAADAAKYDLDQPQISVSLSTAAPATAPSTAPASQPASQTRTLNLGRFADVMKKNVYASVSSWPSIVTVPAATLEKFTVSAISLRDRKVLDIDPQQVSKVVIQSDLAATTRPTTRPASQRTITLERRNEAVALGPTLTPTTAPAATKPSTQAASTQATTQPTTTASTAPAPSRWQLSSTTQPAADAADARVESILASLHPLRATTYLETAPTTQPSATYTITVTTVAAGGAAPVEHVIRLTDPGTSGPVIAQANELVFEVDRSLITKLEGEFTRGATAPTPDASDLPPGIPGLE